MKDYTKLLSLEGKITEVHAKEINEIIEGIIKDVLANAVCQRCFYEFNENTK